MDYTINGGWLAALVFVPFILGLLSGIRVTKQKIKMKLMRELPSDIFQKYLVEKAE